LDSLYTKADEFFDIDFSLLALSVVTAAAAINRNKAQEFPILTWGTASSPCFAYNI
jgi:hypothetical protein